MILIFIDLKLKSILKLNNKIDDNILSIKKINKYISEKIIIKLNNTLLSELTFKF